MITFVDVTSFTQGADCGGARLHAGARTAFTFSPDEVSYRIELPLGPAAGRHAHAVKPR